MDIFDGLINVHVLIGFGYMQNITSTLCMRSFVCSFLCDVDVQLVAQRHAVMLTGVSEIPMDCVRALASLCLC